MDGYARYYDGLEEDEMTSPDDRAAELAARNATTQYRWLTDESEDASGDGIVYADESEYMD